MVKGCGVGTLKCLILTINTVMFLGGLLLAVLSGYTAFNKGSILHQLIHQAHIPGAMTGLYILFAVGLLMAFVSILGCIGAANENRLLLWLNFFFILLIFIMELVATILCFYKYKVVEKDVMKTIKESTHVSANETSTLAALRHVLSLIEKNRKCCGLFGPQDYGDHIPQSCYAVPKKKTSSKTTSGSQKTSSDSDKSSSADAPIESGGEVGSELAKSMAPQPPSTTTTPSPFSPSTPTMSSTTTIPTTSTLPTTMLPPTTTLTTTLPPSTTSISTSTTTSSTTPPIIPTSTTTSTTSTTEPAPVLSNNSTKVTSTTEAVPTTTETVPNTTALVTKGGGSSGGHKGKIHPYTVGCAAKIKPVVYAAGGVAIAILVLELLLLIFIGCLLCEIGSGYESLA